MVALRVHWREHRRGSSAGGSKMVGQDDGWGGMNSPTVQPPTPAPTSSGSSSSSSSSTSSSCTGNGLPSLLTSTQQHPDLLDPLNHLQAEPIRIKVRDKFILRMTGKRHPTGKSQYKNLSQEKTATRRSITVFFPELSACNRVYSSRQRDCWSVVDPTLPWRWSWAQTVKLRRSHHHLDTGNRLRCELLVGCMC